MKENIGKSTDGIARGKEREMTRKKMGAILKSDTRVEMFSIEISRRKAKGFDYSTLLLSSEL